MYTNIGSKIKGLAKAIFFLEAIPLCILGIVIMKHDDDLMAVAFIVMILGVLFSWISSLLLYAIGEIVDTLGNIEYNTRPSEEK